MRVWRRRVAGEGARLGRRFRPVRRSPRAPAAADAHRLESVASREAQIVREAGEDAHAGRPYRMPERDAPAVHVGAIPVRLRVTHSWATASTWAAKAPLRSRRSRSDIRSPTRSSTRAVDGTGPSSIRVGSTPALAHDTSRTSGVSPSSAGRCGVVTTHTAAASFCPLEFPAVTVEPGSPFVIGFSRDGVSREVSAPGVLVCVDDDVTLPPRHRHADDLVGEASSLLGRDRVPV